MKYLVKLSYFEALGNSKTKSCEIRTDARDFEELRTIIRGYAKRFGWKVNDQLTTVEDLQTSDMYTLRSLEDTHVENRKKDIRALKVAGWVGVGCITVLAFAIIFACKGYLPLVQ